MSRIIVTPSATRDLSAITDWISQQSLDGALKFYGDVDQVLQLLSNYPLMGQEVPEFELGLRRHTMGSYLLFYRPLSDGIELIRVLHGSREIERLF